MILDAGVLISIDRSDRSAQTFLAAIVKSNTTLHTSHAVVAQVWRDGARQARLSGFLNTIEIHAVDDGRAVGRLLAEAGTSDVVDAHLVIMALRLGHNILTGDPGDLEALTAVLGAAAPIVHSWP